MSKLLERLNPSQRKAVTHETGPLLIIAGPGSGKTRTVVHSIAYAIENGVLPDRILAFSFTGKACGELRDRVKKFVGEEKGKRVQISTFHGFCRRVLREDIEKLGKGYKQSFKELKTPRQKIVINEERAKVRAQINYLQHHKFPKTKDILDFITRCKLRFIPPSASREHAPDPEMSQAYMEIYERYESARETNGWVDYADQLLLTNELFTSVPKVKTKWQEYIDLIFVDEYQDTDPVQYCIVKALVEDHQNLRVVGDDDQGIYGFRGADIQNILNFKEDYPKEDYPTAKEIRLEENYRSTQRIVAVSNALIKWNPDRIKKELFTWNFEGENVKHLHCKNATEEINVIVSFIIRAVQYGWDFKDFAILCRLNSQVDEFTNAFRGILQGENDVSVMTIHKAKGLEFPNVFVAGVCKRLLPFAENEQNEERRLLYVAMTRAQNWLCLSSYENNLESVVNGISPFLDQIPGDLLDSIKTLDDFNIPPKPVKSNGTKSSTVIAEPLESIARPPIRPETVLGIDPGKIDANKPNVGWAITQRSAEGYAVIDCNTETPIGAPDDKLRQIEHQIKKLIASHAPDAIAVEKLEGAADKGLIGVAGCVALVRYIADQYGIERAFYSPQQVKYAATGNRNADKDQVEEGVKKRCSIRLVQNSNNINDHSADAIAASLCYLDSYLNSSHLQQKKRKQEHYDSGLVYLFNGQYDAAGTEFKEAISIDPIYTEAHYGLGRVYIGQSDLEAAENAAKTALRLAKNNHPDSQKLLEAIKYYRSGCNFANNKQFDKAIRVFQGSIDMEPIFLDAHCGLSRAYLGMSNLEAAKNVVKKALKLGNDYSPIQQLSHAISLYNAGLDFLNDWQYNDAIDKLKEAIDKEPIFIEAHYRLGLAYFGKRALEASQQSANNILELCTDHQLALALLDDIKQTYINKGQDYLRQDELIAAEESAREARRLDPNYQPAQELLDAIKQVYYNRGCYHLDNRRYDEAIVTFEKIVNKYPRFTAAYCGLGRAFLEQDKLIEAENAAKEALRLEDDNQIALQVLEDIKRNTYERGMDYLGQDDLVSAEESANEILRIDSNYQLAKELLNAIQQEYYKQGGIYIETGKYLQAINSLLKASDINPDDKDAWTNLGRAYYWLDEYANAANCYRKAANLDPKDKTIHNNLGNAYYWMGLYYRAIRSLLKAKSIEPNCKKTLCYLARVYFNCGKLKQAKRLVIEISEDDYACKLLRDIDQEISNCAKDSSEMVLIPADHSLGAFRMDKYLVTNAQYKKFLDENQQWCKHRIDRKYHDGYYLHDWSEDNYPSLKENCPVVYVSWYAAMAYARWAGKQLPTVTKWRKAYNGSRSYGLSNMDREIWEWCFSASDLCPSSDVTDTTVSNFEGVTSLQVLLGGSWYMPPQGRQGTDRISQLPTLTNASVGFRCLRVVS